MEYPFLPGIFPNTADEGGCGSRWLQNIIADEKRKEKH